MKHHQSEDELFLVVKGAPRMKFRGREAVVNKRQFVVLPVAPATAPPLTRKSTSC